MYSFFSRLLFQLDAENAHHLVMGLASVGLKGGPFKRYVQNKCSVSDPCLRQEIAGVTFDHPVGMAAGFDKNAQFLGVLPDFGFAFIEIGTVTGECQPGNARPRLFRLRKDRAILNRMGFNNHGSETVARRLQRFLEQQKGKPLPFRLGMNIGKTKNVPLEDAVDDYKKSFQALYPFADYIVVNVSSPNTPNLRELQEKSKLRTLLGKLQELNMKLALEQHSVAKPMFVKVAPDLTEEALLDVIDVVRTVHAQGIIATNTTISREGLQTKGVEELGAGGISGRPLSERSLEVVKFLYRHAPDLVIIGVGGIFNTQDALRMIRAGASLVQVWTGFIYEGPQIVRKINEGLVRACRNHGWETIREAVGIDAVA